MAKYTDKLFHTAKEELATETTHDQFVAFRDQEFLLRDELRPVRLQLELLKPEVIQREKNIDATLIFFGSARLFESEKAKQALAEAEKKAAEQPNDSRTKKALQIAKQRVANSHYYDEARKLANKVSREAIKGGPFNVTIATGGGPGIMEAANRGAFEAGAPTMGLNIVIPHEQAPNAYVTPELSFPFHYFAIRKMHFLIRAKALIAFPGGFGTLDELFDALTLLQTKKIDPIPLLLFGKDYWSKVINFDFLVDQGVISEEDLDIFVYVETAEEAWNYLMEYYSF